MLQCCNVYDSVPVTSELHTRMHIHNQAFRRSISCEHVTDREMASVPLIGTPCGKCMKIAEESRAQRPSCAPQTTFKPTTAVTAPECFFDYHTHTHDL